MASTTIPTPPPERWNLTRGLSPAEAAVVYGPADDSPLWRRVKTGRGVAGLLRPAVSEAQLASLRAGRALFNLEFIPYFERAHTSDRSRWGHAWAPMAAGTRGRIRFHRGAVLYQIGAGQLVPFIHSGPAGAVFLTEAEAQEAVAVVGKRRKGKGGEAPAPASTEEEAAAVSGAAEDLPSQPPGGFEDDRPLGQALRDKVAAVTVEDVVDAGTKAGGAYLLWRLIRRALDRRS